MESWKRLHIQWNQVRIVSAGTAGISTVSTSQSVSMYKQVYICKNHRSCIPGTYVPVPATIPADQLPATMMVMGNVHGSCVVVSYHVMVYSIMLISLILILEIIIDIRY